MNLYRKFSDKDLIIAYNEMMEISGDISKDLKEVIEDRDGLENFTKKVNSEKERLAEIKRITIEVNKLTSEETNVEFISKFIHSDTLSPDELKLLIEEKFISKKAFLNDKKIDTKLIISSIIAVFTGSVLGATIWAYVVHTFPIIAIPTLVPIYIICYFILKFITKKSKNNIIVFCASIIATILSVLLGANILDAFYSF